MTMTTATMTMTKQEIFTKVVTHLRQQNAKATESEDSSFCMYRNPAGLMCAAGCLIADEHYSPALEGATVDRYTAKGLAVLAALNASGVPEEAMELVRSLQAIHDGASVESWESRFERLAVRHSLEVPSR